MTSPDVATTVAERKAVVQQDLQNVLHPVVPHRQLESEPLVIVEGRGSTVVDADGTEYLDAMAGLWCVNVGYGRTELAEVAAAQMRALPYYPHTAMNAPAAALAERVNGLLGGDNHVYFVASGSEANEAGFKIARQYMKHEHPGQLRYKTITRYLGYHGTTLATLAAGGMGDRKMKFEPLGGNDFVHVAPPYCYRCPFGLTYPSCELACVKNIEATIQGEGPDTVSTVLVEPIMSAVGVAVPPDEYLPEVAAIEKKYGCLLHIDEVINGFGRTGAMFAHQHYGVRPDMVSIAKGLVSAYLPIAATVVRNEVFQSFVGEPSENRQVFQISTYGGHPVAAAVAGRNIDIILRERLVERAAENGAYLLDRLRTLEKHPWVGDVRGKGLLAGVELVKDRRTKEVVGADRITRLVDFARHRGVIVGRSGGGRHLGSVIVLSPPLVITRAEIDRVVAVLDDAIADMGKTLLAS
jgi:adenosylmethionine-8-amino-7-oxononanoate aminotransferase